MHIPRRRKAISVALLAAALIPATLTTATAAEPGSPDVPSVTTGVQRDSAQSVRDFWTPARVSRALANEEADDAAFARKVKAAAKASKGEVDDSDLALAAEAQRVLPSGKTVLTSSSVDIPEVPVAREVPFPQTPPAVVVGKILYIAKDGKEHGCTGASIASDSGNTVWTAGHCIHPGDGSGADGFHTKITFMPGFKKNTDNPDGYDAPWGKWTATKKVAPTQWTADGDVEDADLAAFDVTVPTGYTSLTAAVGALGYRFGDGSDFSDVIDSGFPGEGYHRTDMDGFKQFYCTGNAEDAFDWNPLDDRVKVDCDMGKGASGGPIATTEGQIVSVNSHYETLDDEVTRKNDDLFGSEHMDKAVAVIDEINS
ncbi:trypsin-like serine peptidase [Streptomyces sp. CA-132043]|uniref:trypsin-like serine peptidase n=1 Tax=Streptomyces sp. CA-132043 TaxID=3240048 RepID=UPI003D8B5899